MKDFLVHFHLYYFDQVDFFIEKLMTVKNHPNSTYDLFVTMREHNKDAEDKIKAEFPDAKFIICKNVGADIWPFIVVLNQVNLDDYKYIVKVHTKRWVETSYLLGKYRAQTHGWAWRDMLMNILQPKNFKRSITAFECNKRLGMVADYRLLCDSNQDDNETKEKTQELLSRFGFSSVKYVAGTMFIVRATLMQPVKDLKLTESDFESFQSGKSSQLAHAMERFLGCSVLGKGYLLKDTFTSSTKKLAASLKMALHLPPRVYYKNNSQINVYYGIVRKKWAPTHRETRILGLRVSHHKNSGV